jgi:tetratricopeptide (TPR) repeat protein
MTAHALANLGEVRHLQGDVLQAEALYQEALTLFRELGEKRGIAFALLQLGKVKLAQSDLDQATERFVESLTIRREVGEKPAIIESLEALAGIASRRGDAALAVRIFAAADAHRLTLGPPLAASYSGEREQVLADARHFLGEAAFAEVWTRGQVLSLEESVTEVVSMAPTVAYVGIPAD